MLVPVARVRHAAGPEEIGAGAATSRWRPDADQSSSTTEVLVVITFLPR